MKDISINKVSARCFSLLATCVIILFFSLRAQAQEIKGNFAIKNLASGLLLRPLDANKKNETPIVGYSPINWKCMTWTFENISGNTYSLRNLFTNKTFQPKGSEIKEGNNLEQQPLVLNQPLQQWEFISSGKNLFLIRLKGTELYLSSSTATGNEVILSAKKSDATQQWTIYEQDPEI